jgi:hypothetical protein
LPGCPSMASPNLPGLSAGFARAQGARYVVAAISAAMGDRRLPRPAPPRLGADGAAGGSRTFCACAGTHRARRRLGAGRCGTGPAASGGAEPGV